MLCIPSFCLCDFGSVSWIKYKKNMHIWSSTGLYFVTQISYCLSKWTTGKLVHDIIRLHEWSTWPQMYCLDNTQYLGSTKFSNYWKPSPLTIFSGCRSHVASSAKSVIVWLAQSRRQLLDTVNISIHMYFCYNFASQTEQFLTSRMCFASDDSEGLPSILHLQAACQKILYKIMPSHWKSTPRPG